MNRTKHNAQAEAVEGEQEKREERKPDGGVPPSSLSLFSFSLTSSVTTFSPPFLSLSLSLLLFSLCLSPSFSLLISFFSIFASVSETFTISLPAFLFLSSHCHG